MPFWYFLPIPKLPREDSEQSNQVQLRKYLRDEGDAVEPGTPIALLENRWAVMRLKASGTGILRRIFFDPETYVKVGDPIAIIGAEGENIPYGKGYAVWEVVQQEVYKPE